MSVVPTWWPPLINCTTSRSLLPCLNTNACAHKISTYTCLTLILAICLAGYAKTMKQTLHLTAKNCPTLGPLNEPLKWSDGCHFLHEPISHKNFHPSTLHDWHASWWAHRPGCEVTILMSIGVHGLLFWWFILCTLGFSQNLFNGFLFFHFFCNVFAEILLYLFEIGFRRLCIPKPGYNSHHYLADIIIYIYILHWLYLNFHSSWFEIVMFNVNKWQNDWDPSTDVL